MWRPSGVPCKSKTQQAEGATDDSLEYDPLRDGPLRFLGYTNEVG